MTTNPPDLPSLLAAGERLRPSHPKAPEIWKLLWEGEALLLKSYHHAGPAYRQTVGRLAISREWDALSKLSGKQVAPAAKWRLSPWSMVMEWVDGFPLEAYTPTDLCCQTLLGQAEKLLHTLEASHLAHADLGHDFWGKTGRPSNLIWTRDHRLVAIDFAGSVPLNRGPAAARKIARALQLHDQLLPTKILYHFADDSFRDHPAWQLPARRGMPWWDLMRALGKV